MTTYVYDFSHGDKDQKDLLGGKGANLAEMTRLGLPVPPGFTITTHACRAYLRNGSLPPELPAQVVAHLDDLETTMNRKLGDPADPLLVSVRSGAKFSMPGMMDTVLNVGLTDASVTGLAAQAEDERFAWDSYRRLIQMFGKTVLDMDGEAFERAIDETVARAGVSSEVELDAETLRQLVSSFKNLVHEHTGKPFPQDPRRAAVADDRSRLPVLEQPTGPPVPTHRAHTRRPGDGRQHRGDGLRQPRRRFGDRRRLHP